eukprot:1202947-Alexandrium_andersonii.AAC.1
MLRIIFLARLIRVSDSEQPSGTGFASVVRRASQAFAGCGCFHYEEFAEPPPAVAVVAPSGPAAKQRLTVLP